MNCAVLMLACLFESDLLFLYTEKREKDFECKEGSSHCNGNFRCILLCRVYILQITAGYWHFYVVDIVLSLVVKVARRIARFHVRRRSTY